MPSPSKKTAPMPKEHPSHFVAIPSRQHQRTIRLNSGTSLWLGYFTDATRDPRTVSVGVGRSTDSGRKFTWTKGNVAFPRRRSRDTPAARIGRWRAPGQSLRGFPLIRPWKDVPGMEVSMIPGTAPQVNAAF